MSGAGAIVLVTTSFPMRGDGSEAAGSFVLDLVHEISRCRPVSVVAPGPASIRESVAPGIEVFRYRAPSRPLSTLKPWRPGDLRDLFETMRSGQTATRAAVAAGATAHILALWALPSGHWARRVARETGIPYSVWTLGSDIWSLGRIPLVRHHLGNILRDATACFSDGLRLAADTASIGTRQVEFLPSTRGIRRARTVPPRASPPYRMLYLGRWHPNKGVDLLLEALRILPEEDWERLESLEICGGGPLEPLVRSCVDALRQAGRPVTLHGYLDKDAAEEAVLRADWLLIPSRIESIPVVFSDAMKLRAPVVAMPTGDLPQLVGGMPPTGVLAGRIDAAAFADALSTALRGSPAAYVAGMDVQAARFRLDAIAQRIVGLADAPAP